MRRSFLVILMLLLACSFATAADYVKTNLVNGDTEYQNGDFLLSFYMTYECPAPSPMAGISLGFNVYTTGTATFSHADDAFTKFHDTDWFNVGGLIFDDTPIVGTDLTTGTILFGGAYNSLFPGDGLEPPVTDEKFIDIEMSLGNEFGDDFCIDSGFVPPGGTWKFSNMTCGTGGAPDRPLFLDGNGDDVHPICITVEEFTCAPPTINVTPVGDAISVNHCNGTSFPFGADPGMNGPDPATITGWDVISGDGSIDVSGTYLIGPHATGTYDVTIQVTNDCGGVDDYSFQVVFTNNAPTFVDCPIDKNASTESATSIQLEASDIDPCDGLSFYLVDDAGFGSDVDVTAAGLFTWDPTAATAGTYTFTAGVVDTEGGTAECTINVTLIAGRPLDIVIEKEEGGDEYNYQGVIQGKYVTVSIFLASFNTAAPVLEQEAPDLGLGGFDFLVAYDASALTFVEAFEGKELTDNDWEYFTYRYNYNGNCGNACPSGYLRVVAMAELNDGPNHPTFDVEAGAPFNNEPDFDGELVQLKFYVTNDRTYECQFVPIYFYWFDCTDNVVSDPTGNKAYVAEEVFNFYDWTTAVQDYGSTALADYHDGGNYILVDAGLEFYFPQYVEWECDVDNSDGKGAIPVIRFFNGGVDIICSEDIDARGDVNLNNIANEIADAVMFTNYFIYGISAFVDGKEEGSIAATDVNADGNVLTVGDLVYLIRIITGDASPYAKLSPFASNVEFVLTDGVVTANAGTDMGAALFVFDVEGQAEATLNVDGLKMLSDMVDGQLRVLVYGDALNASIPANADVITVSGNATLVEAAAADYYGSDLNVVLKDGILPTSFSLTQNYPNPFNPSTAIDIKLPTQSEYRIDVYNVAGQLVKSVSGNGVGVVTEVIDMSGQASGIYFYKATAGQYTDTKKMVLMK